MRSTWLIPLTAFLAVSLVPSPVPAAQTRSLQAQMHAMQLRLNALEQQVNKLKHSRAPRTVSRRAASRPAFAWKYSGTAYPKFAVDRSASIPPPSGSGASSDGNSFGQQAPTQNSVNSVYEEQNALFRKGLTITPGATYTYGDDRFFTLNGFLALGAIFLGNIDVSRQQSSVFSPNVNLTYGVNKRLQFDMTVPFEIRSTTYVSAGADQSAAQVSQRTIKSGGIGDINAGVYYQLRSRSLSAPKVVLNAHFTAPTGSSPYGIKIARDDHPNDNISYAERLPTGQGVWGVSAGATVMKQYDPVILFAGGNVYYNFSRHYADISPYQGTVQPGSVKPGNAVSFTFGTAFSLNDRMSTSFSFQDSMVDAAALRADGGPWQTVGGSSFNAAVFNIGLTYAENKNVSWQTLLGIGVTHDAPSFQLSIRVPHNP